MVIDNVDTFINELSEDVFEDQISDEIDAEIKGKVPTINQHFYPLCLYQCKNMAIINCNLHFGKEGIALHIVAKLLQNHPNTV